jgi:hypothetical protein
VSEQRPGMQVTTDVSVTNQTVSVIDTPEVTMTDVSNRWIEISGDTPLCSDSINSELGRLVSLPLFDMARNDHIQVSITYDPSRDQLSVKLKRVM